MRPKKERRESKPGLRRKGLFGEYMLASWGYVEGLVDLFVWDIFRLPAADPISDLFFDLLSQVRFDWKIVTLKHLKVITNVEYRTIRSLQLKRNKLFHSSGEEFATLFADQEKREDGMKAAGEATKACAAVYQRQHPELLSQFQSTQRLRELTKVDKETDGSEMTGN